MSSKIPVSFLCQRCHSALRIHQSLENIDSEFLSDFARLTVNSQSAVGQQHSYANKRHEDQISIRSASGPASRETDETSEDRYSRLFSLDDDFAVVGVTRASSDTEAHGIKLKAQAFLFDMLSSSTTIDHPLCADCCDTLMSTLNSQLQQLEKEQTDYSRFLNEINEQNLVETDEVGKLDSEIEKLEKKARALEEERAALARDQQMVETELDTKRDELASVERSAESCFRDYYATKYEVNDLEEEVLSLTKQCAFAETQLARLRGKAALDIAFRIDSVTQGGVTVGTINGLRMTRLDSAAVSSADTQSQVAPEPGFVDWNEVNAALGQVCLCLQSLARKLNFEFDKYRLVPMGNYSVIESVGPGSKDTYLLYYSGQFMASKKLDQALSALLDCLQQIQTKIIESDSEIRFPFRIVTEKNRLLFVTPAAANEKPVEYSISASNSKREEWTRACHCLLTNLKFCIVWCSSRIE